MKRNSTLTGRASIAAIGMICKKKRFFTKRNFGGGSVMVWAAIGSDGLVALAFVSLKMNSADYQNVLEEHLIPMWAPDSIFQQDNLYKRLSIIIENV